jgi:NADH:ubiquinone oxidoreductase subunit 6 (subunit J)
MNVGVGEVIFAASGLAILFSAVAVVLSKDLVHAVLWLAVTLVATSTLYVTLAAEFIGAVQILLYAGGVITLMLFGLMLTSRITGARLLTDSHHRIRGGVMAALVFGLLTAGIVRSPAPPPLSDAALAALDDSRALGHLFLTEQVLTLEVLSVLLLAVMVGAIVLARRKDPS